MKKKTTEREKRLKTLNDIRKAQSFYLSRYIKEMGGRTKCDPAELERLEKSIKWAENNVRLYENGESPIHFDCFQ